MVITENLAEEIITSILNYRKQGIDDESELINKLEVDYEKNDIDFEWFFEMMNTGAFRASFVMTYGKYPPNNLENNVVLKTAFKMYWIEQRGEEDYIARFASPKKRWWQFK